MNKKLRIYLGDLSYYNIRSNFGPLNMAKTWIYSKENVRKVNFNG